MKRPKKEFKTEAVLTRLRPSERAALRALAVEEDVAESEVVRRILLPGIEEWARKKKRLRSKR